MGKTILAVVGVVASVAILIFAPEIGLALATALHIGTSAAIAIVTAVAGVAASLALGFAAKALGIGAPSATHAVSPPAMDEAPCRALKALPRPYPQGTAVISLVCGGTGHPLVRSMRPVSAGFLQRWRRGQVARCSIVELVGHCMAPKVTDGYAIVDRHAEIRAGDLFSFGVKDHARAFGHLGAVNGVTKRFLGVDRQLGFVECDCAAPACTIHTGLSNLLWAHRIRATAPSLKEAKQLLAAVRRHPFAFDQRLAA